MDTGNNETTDDYAQDEFACRLEWGWRGAGRAARRGDVLIIVDVLSFSTTSATAVQHGAIIYPCTTEPYLRTIAHRTGAVRGVHRNDVPKKGKFSLSPLSFSNAPRGVAVALSSPNGATCCNNAINAYRQNGQPSTVFVGAIINAEATARAAAEIAARENKPITVLACGERWGDEKTGHGGDGPLRFAVEDFWGAGAILSFLPATLSRSPEARAAQAAWKDAAPDLEKLLLDCGSGRELVRKGYDGDVRHAARLNLYDTPAALERQRFADKPDSYAAIVPLQAV